MSSLSRRQAVKVMLITPFTIGGLVVSVMSLDVSAKILAKIDASFVKHNITFLHTTC